MRPIVFDKEPAYTLHRRPYQDTGALIEVLTANHGRITMIARTSVKTIGNTLQPFTPMLLTCSGGDELYNLRGVDTRGKSVLVGPEAMMLGLYVNELTTRLVPKHVKSNRLFSLYSDTLTCLAESEREPALRVFEAMLLKTLGHGLQLHYEAVSHEPLKTENLYFYEPGTGPLHSSGEGLSDLPLCHGATLLAFERGFVDYDNQMLKEARDLMRAVISYYLHGREIKTRSIFRFLQELT